MYTQDMQNKTRNMETKIGLVSKKYYTNQNSFAHLSFRSENQFQFYQKFGSNVARGLFTDSHLIMDNQRFVKCSIF